MAELLRHSRSGQHENSPLQDWPELLIQLVWSILRQQCYLGMLLIPGILNFSLTPRIHFQYYLPLLLAEVGITNPNTQILLNAVYAITGWIAATIGARFHDVLGRRIMFMGSTLGMILCLSIAAGGAAGFVNTGSVPASDASISFIYGR